MGGLAQLSLQSDFRRKQALEIRSFVDSIAANDIPSRLFVHCHAGLSRSAAVSKYVAQLYKCNLIGNLDKYNITVFEVLQDPDKYESLIKPDKHDWISNLKRMFS